MSSVIKIDDIEQTDKQLVDKEDVLTILMKNWHDYSGDDAMQKSIDDVRGLKNGREMQ